MSGQNSKSMSLATFGGTFFTINVMASEPSQSYL